MKLRTLLMAILLCAGIAQAQPVVPDFVFGHNPLIGSCDGSIVGDIGTYYVRWFTNNPDSGAYFLPHLLPNGTLDPEYTTTITVRFVTFAPPLDNGAQFFYCRDPNNPALDPLVEIKNKNGEVVISGRGRFYRSAPDPATWTGITGDVNWTDGLLASQIVPATDILGNGSMSCTSIHGSAGCSFNLTEVTQPAPMQAFVSFAGDTDGDMDVDMTDFGAFSACYAGSNSPTVLGCDRSDLDGDGDVDIQDFMQFRACFNGANRVPACK